LLKGAHVLKVLAGRDRSCCPLSPELPAPPYDLTSVAARIREECGLDVVVVDQSLGLKDDPPLFQFGFLGGHILDPACQVANPGLIDARRSGRPAEDLDRHTLIVGEKVTRRASAALDNDAESQGVNVEVLEGG